MGRVSTTALGLAAGTLLVAGGGAYALASSSTATITVCVSHRSGTLYAAHKCNKRDKRLSWNTAGRRGAQGPRGLQGPEGVQGASGLPGSPAASVMTARTDAVFGQEGYFAASGPSTISSTESDVTVLTPAVPIIAQDLAVRDEVSSPDDNTRIYVLRVNGADTALTCSIVLGAHDCTDTTHSVTIPADSEVTIHRAVTTGTGGGADDTAVLAAWRASTP